jgi:hypothetical protein
MLKRRPRDLEEAPAASQSSGGSGDDQYDCDDDSESRSSQSFYPQKILLSLCFLIILTLFVYTNEAVALFNNLKGTYEFETIEHKLPSHIVAITEPEIIATEPPLPPVAVVNEPIVEPEEMVDTKQLIEELEPQALALVQQLREMKQKGMVMETDPEALQLIPKAQALLREVLILKYGPGPYRVSMGIKFPASMSSPDDPAPETNLLIDLAPIEFIPYSVYFFLEYVVQEFKSGDFHRNAGHVLQAMLTGTKPSLSFAWQEYSPKFPHKKYTLGYAGRPSGSRAIYISTVDNTHNHGPASQGSKTEADCIFGEVTDGKSIEIIQKMEKQPGATPGAGWISDKNNYIHITSIELVSSPN